MRFFYSTSWFVTVWSASIRQHYDFYQNDQFSLLYTQLNAAADGLFFEIRPYLFTTFEKELKTNETINSTIFSTMSIGLAITALVCGAMSDRSVLVVALLLHLVWEQMDSIDVSTGTGWEDGRCTSSASRAFSFLARLPLSHSLGRYVCGIFLHHYNVVQDYGKHS